MKKDEIILCVLLFISTILSYNLGKYKTSSSIYKAQLENNLDVKIEKALSNVFPKAE